MTLGLVIVMMWGAIAVSIAYSRQAALEDAHVEGRNLMIAFREQVAYLLRGIEAEMTLLAKRVQSEGSGFDLYKWGQESILVQPGLAQATLLGPDGQFLSSTVTATPDTTDFSDREHFRVHLGHRITGLYIGRSVTGRMWRTPLLPISMRIDTPDGNLLGVLVILVDPSAITGLHKQMNLGAHGVMTLAGTDNVIRARYSMESPDGKQNVGDSLAGGERRNLADENAEGHFIKRSIIDGITRVYDYGRVGSYPMVVNVGLDLDEELAAARQHAETLGVLGLLATIFLLGLAGYLIREIRIRSRYEFYLVEEGHKLQCANLALVESKNRAEAASQAKSLFLANMSHELRTPLNAIIGYSEVIRDQLFGASARDKYVEYAGDVVRSGEHLLGLINQVLDTAKIEAGKLRLDDDMLSFSELVERSLRQVNLVIERKRLSVSCDIARDLPAVRGDGGRLRQVLINLLSNAAKFTPEGGGVHIDVGCDAAGDLVCCVTDTGIGMSPEEVAIALQPFAQVENELTKSYEGTGLGLPLAKRLVELHGGSLDVESAKGLGTTIRLRLPAERVFQIIDTSVEDPPQPETWRNCLGWGHELVTAGAPVGNNPLYLNLN